MNVNFAPRSELTIKTCWTFNVSLMRYDFHRFIKSGAKNIAHLFTSSATLDKQKSSFSMPVYANVKKV